MDWIREHKTLATIIGGFLAAALALGVFLVLAFLTYGESREAFERANNSLAGMKSADLFPSPENLTAKKNLVEEYAEKVATLSKVLTNLQPSPDPISETDFQAKLKSSIAEIRSLAAKSTQLPGDFSLGFPEYTSSLPKSAAVARELSDYLDATDAVVRTIINAGVESIDTLERSPLPSEGTAPVAPVIKKPNAPQETEPPLVERRTLTLTLTTDQIPLQVLLNTLASPSQMPHFTAVRLLRIENEKQEGPLRSEVVLSLPQAPTDVENTGSTEPIIVINEGINVGTPGAGAQAGTQPGRKDAVDVLGQEKLKVYLEIDLIRFNQPDPEKGKANN